jgi:hypothetical protein
MTLKELWEQMLGNAEPDWVREMKEHYAKTGTYRPEDLRRLLGDPTKRIDVRERANLASCLHK